MALLVPLCPCDLLVEQGHMWLWGCLSEQELGTFSFCPRPCSVGVGHIPPASPSTQSCPSLVALSQQEGGSPWAELGTLWAVAVPVLVSVCRAGDAQRCL